MRNIKNLYSKETNNLLELGILNLLSPIIVLIATLAWGLIFMVIICIEVLGLDTIPIWAVSITILPLVFAPISCVWGIINGFINRKKKNAWACIVLSFAGIVLFVVMMYWLLYIGTNF